MSDARVMLELQKVSLSFQARKEAFSQGTHHVLQDVDLKLCEGETLGIIGKNGSGKTTILRLMAGIFGPTSGRIVRAKGVSSALLTIGLGFRGDLSGRDNAVLSGMLQGLSRRQAEAYLEEILDFSELGDSFDEPVKTYSSGMRARLGFTTALITHVDILLVDEVLSVGDAHFKKKAEKAMKERIIGEQTVVFVSHSDAQIASLCDRVVWLNDAVVAGEGEVDQVLSEYQSYVSSMGN
ncbi:MAG: ATP-binding cassette domain-containing protein [Halioglobus sp.]